MTTHESTTRHITVSASGIGGIDETEVSLEAGVNLLVGRNATNRTSFLQAIIAGLGSDAASLKADREEGAVELTIDGTTCTRSLTRTAGGIQFDGEPYLDDPTIADLFAFLLESNEARQSVRAGSGLRDVLLRPIDTDEIDNQIRELQTERTRIDDRIEALERKRDQLPALEKRRKALEEKRTAARDTLEELREELAAADADLETKQDAQEELEGTLDELQGARTELDSVHRRLETERIALESARTEQEKLEAEREALPETDEQKIAALEAELSTLRQRKRTLDSRISKLNQIIQFNEELLAADGTLGELFDDEESTTPTDALVEDETTCWTCGSSIETNAVEGMVEQLRATSNRMRTKRREIEDSLESVREERDGLAEAQEQFEEIATQLEELGQSVERREERIAELESEEVTLQERIESLEAAVDRLEGVSDSEVLELHRRVTEQERTVEKRRDALSEVVGEIEELEAAGEEIENLERQREQISEQLTELRTRIDRIEANAVEAFNEHMDSLLDLLEYENIARVWIEQQNDSAQNADTSRFDLHIVRTMADGTTYEDTIDHLSESERELVGLVFALAGYLVHEVYEMVPVMVLDSLEAIDADRIAALIGYLSEYSPIIVAALLQEDAQALDPSYCRIEHI